MKRAESYCGAARLLVLVVLAALSPRAARGEGSGYASTFDGPAGDQWSTDRTAVTPSGQRFLGTFGNETATLSLSDLSAHTHVVISLDLYIIGPWGGSCGSASTPGVPSEWSMTLDGATEVVHGTFSNDDALGGRPQSYPDGGDIRNPPRRGAFKVNELGYVDGTSGARRDSVYKLFFTVKHVSPKARLDFSATGLSDTESQAWGIDNVSIVCYDMSASELEGGDAALLGLGSGASGGGTGGGAGAAGFVPGDIPSGGGGGGGSGGGGGGGGGPPPTPPGPTNVPSPGSGGLLGLAALRLLRRPTRERTDGSDA